MADSKLVAVKLPFPVSLNGELFEGKVNVDQTTADELKRIVAEASQNGVAFEAAKEEE